MGFSLHTFLQIADLVVAPVLAASGVPPALIPVITHGMRAAEIASAERAVPLTGAEKKAMVLDGVSTAIAGINAVKPDAVDPNVTALVGRGIDVAIGTVKAIHKQPIA